MLDLREAIDASLVELGGLPLRHTDRELLIRCGVPPRFLEEDYLGQLSPLFHARGRFSYDGRWFDPAANGIPVILVEIRDQFSQPLDWLAWHPQTGRYAFFQSQAPILGLENCFRPRLSPLVAHKTILSWIKNGRGGIFIANAEQSAAWLQQAGQINFECVAQASAVRDASTLKNIFVLTSGVSK